MPRELHAAKPFVAASVGVPLYKASPFLATQSSFAAKAFRDEPSLSVCAAPTWISAA
jgi:hypothetical protein